MTTPPTVRRATGADAPALVVLREAMLASLAREPVPDNGWREACEQALREKLKTESTEYAAFVVDGPDGVPVSGVVGWLNWHPPGPAELSGRAGFIASMSTLPEARGRGYARATFTALMAWFEEIGATRVELLASDFGEPLYTQFGFKVSASKAMRWVRQR
jgi:GNAT superfamily N-acetyltransferase